MKVRKSGNIIAARLDRGEKIIESISKICSENGIKCGFFHAIGAVDEAEIAHYTVETKEYSSKKLKAPLEIVSLSGNVSVMETAPYIHCHACFSDESMNSYAGHLKEARISATCELFIVAATMPIERKFDEKIGLNLLDL